jgi:hypothetical protein
VGDPLHEPTQQRQGQSSAGLAVGRIREAPLRGDDATQVTHGDVAVQRLGDHEQQRGGRVQDAITPVVLFITGQLPQQVRIEQMGQVALDLGQSEVDTGHPWPPWLMGCDNTIFSGGRVLRQ